jgi:hypothetical protein
MRTFINSRAMALTLALASIDDEVKHAQHHRRPRRSRRTRDANAPDGDDR